MKKTRYESFSAFPNSRDEPFKITSPDDGKYNCIAWVLGITEFPIWPILDDPYRWPEELPRIETVDNFIAFFKIHGFKSCADDLPERGMEKIALFEKDGIPKHACRLLKNGLWTSKIGIWEDVQHSLPAISGGMYGEVAVFMKRKTGATGRAKK